MSSRADRLIEDVDWRQLARTLHMRRLLPTLGPRLVELAKGHTSDDFQATVDHAVDAGRRHGIFLQLVARRAIAMLADAGIRCSALKGPLLGEAIYGDPGRRPSGDIDLLVPPEQLQVAVEVIRALGYGAPSDYVDASGLPLLHLMLVHDRGELPVVELHWRVHWYERRFACDRLLPPVPESLGHWRPAPADELAALLLFYARDGFSDLRLASDLGAWWDVCGADLPVGALDELLRTYPALARVIGAALEVAERLVGLPAPLLVGNSPTLGFRGAVAVRLANPHPTASRSQLYADMGLIDGLLIPRGGFGAFVRRQVIPPPEVLDQQARHGARARARSPVARGVGVVGRYALTMTRLLRTHGALR